MLTQKQQHSAFQRGMDVFELRLRVQAGRARNSHIRLAAKTYESGGSVPAHLALAQRGRIEKELSSHYLKVGDYFGKLALSAVRKRRKSLTPVQALMAEWVRREAARKAKLIADTDRDGIAGVIDAGVAEGLGTAEIARNIRRMTATTPYRAALIARTETHAAATYGSIESVRDAESSLGVRMLKSWLPTSDNRTRPEHLAMRSHPAIPLDEKFSVGGELMDRPGDPGASPAQICNCRCSITYSEAE